jgi:hypothetical protein
MRWSSVWVPVPMLESHVSPRERQPAKTAVVIAYLEKYMRGARGEAAPSLAAPARPTSVSVSLET